MSTPAATPDAGGRILIVEDDPLTRKSLAALFDMEGFAVTQAGDGREALEQMAAATVDVVLADLNMPRMSGLELLRAARVRHAGVPVILISGYGTEESALEALRAGAYDYVTKPVLDEHLTFLVRRAVTERKREAEIQRLRREVEALRAGRTHGSGPG